MSFIPAGLAAAEELAATAGNIAAGIDAAQHIGEQVGSAISRFVSPEKKRRIGPAGSIYAPNNTPIRIYRSFMPYRRRRFRRRRYLRKRRARFSRAGLGHPYGLSTSKAAVVQNVDNLGLGDGVLHASGDYFNIERGEDRDRRERNQVRITGFQIKGGIRNRNDTPIFLNIALISPRNKDVLTSGASNYPEFFRGNGAERGQAAIFSGSGSNSGWYNHIQNINTDLYYVLFHKRFKVIGEGTSNQTWTEHTGKNYFYFKWWIPLKRTIRYSSSSGTSGDAHIQLVWWFAKQDRPAGQTINDTILNFTCYTKCYFKDVLCW